jgi:hypothetical protein
MSIHLNSNFSSVNNVRPTLNVILNSEKNIKVNINDYNPSKVDKVNHRHNRWKMKNNRDRFSLSDSMCSADYEYDFNKWLQLYNSVLYDIYELYILPYKNSNCGIFDKVKFGGFCYFMYQNSSLLKTKYL